jgi:hypothetical protein
LYFVYSFQQQSDLRVKIKIVEESVKKQPSEK